MRTPATRTLVPAAPRLSVCHGDSLSARMPGLRGYTRKCQAFSLAALANGRLSGRAVRAAPAKPAASDRSLVFGDSTSPETNSKKGRTVSPSLKLNRLQHFSESSCDIKQAKFLTPSINVINRRMANLRHTHG